MYPQFEYAEFTKKEHFYKWQSEDLCNRGRLSVLDYFNYLGNQGWELVSVVGNCTSWYDKFIFKRQKISESYRT